MYKGFSVICIMLCCLNGYAQLKSKKPLSALMTDLRKTTPDTNRVYVLLQIANYYLERVPPSEHKLDSALLYIQAAIKITDNIKHEALKQEAVHCLAKYYFNNGNTERGKSILLNIITFEKDRGNIAGETRWLIDLEDHIPDTDTVGLTRTECLERLALLYDPVRDRKERIKTESKLVEIYFIQGKIIPAEQKIFKILELYSPIEPDLIWSSYYILSEINRYRGNLNKALMYSLECIRAAERAENINTIEYVFGQLGLIYQELGVVETSIDWYKKSLEVRIEKQVEPFVIYRTAGFLVQQLIRQKNIKEASTVINQVLKQTYPRSGFDSATLFQLKANYYNSINKHDLAEPYYRKMIESIHIFKEDPEIAVIAYQDIGEFYLLRRQYEKSKFYLKNALGINLAVSTPSRIRDIHYMLYTADSSTGDYSSALSHIRQYQKINDSLFNAGKSRQIEELKIQYETEKVSQDNRILEKESKLQQNKLMQADLTRNWILGALGAMLVFLGFLLYNARVKQRTNRKLQMQQLEISQKNTTLNHLINEKEWLIKEIHHRVKNNFHMVIGLLDTQSEYLKNEEALVAIKESQRRIQAMAFIHQKLYQSTNLSSVEMSAYIHELVDYLQHSFNKGQQVLFRLDIMKLSLNLSHALPLALILNEAITNSIKYGFRGSKTGIIRVSLVEEHTGRFLLTIADDGMGIPLNFNYKDSDTMGMKLMEGLCEDIHGNLEIKNKAGTTITISFEYDASASSEITLNNMKVPTETVI
jgi:two-component sensor histidine kinase